MKNSKTSITFTTIFIITIAVGIFGVGKYFEINNAQAAGTCNILKSDDFENYSLCCQHSCTGQNWMYSCERMVNCASISTELGQKSWKFDLKYDDIVNITNEIYKRCEYHWMNGTEKLLNLYPGNEYWLAFSIYFPSDWRPDSRFGHIIFQMHQNFDSCDTLANPPMALSYGSDGRLSLHFAGDSRECMSGSYETSKTIYLGNVTPGEWHDFVIHMKISYDPDAFVQAWMNGEKKADYQNVRTCYNTSGGTKTYLKFGLYTWSWKNTYYQNGEIPDPSRIILHYDNIKLGDNTCSYSDFIVPAVPPPIAICPNAPSSNSSFQNTAISSQTGTFKVEYDSTPLAAGLDALTAFSSEAGLNFTDYAMLIRFNP